MQMIYLTEKKLTLIAVVDCSMSTNLLLWIHFLNAYSDAAFRATARKQLEPKGKMVMN